MSPKQKPTYEQALALEKAQTAARKATRARRTQREPGVEERTAYMRQFSTELLERLLRSPGVTAVDQAATRVVLAERTEER